MRFLLKEIREILILEVKAKAERARKKSMVLNGCFLKPELTSGDFKQGKDADRILNLI